MNITYDANLVSTINRWKHLQETVERERREDHGTNDRKWLGLVGYVYSLVGSRVGHTNRS